MKRNVIIVYYYYYIFLYIIFSYIFIVFYINFMYSTVSLSLYVSLRLMQRKRRRRNLYGRFPNFCFVQNFAKWRNFPMFLPRTFLFFRLKLKSKNQAAGKFPSKETFRFWINTNPHTHARVSERSEPHPEEQREKYTHENGCRKR